MRALFSTSQWLSWFGVTLVSVLTLCAYVYGNFITKSDYVSNRTDDNARLVRIEEKLDRLVERLPGSR